MTFHDLFNITTTPWCFITLDQGSEGVWPHLHSNANKSYSAHREKTILMFLQTSDLGFAIYPLKHIIQDVLARNLYKRLLKATYVNHEVIQADVKNMCMFLMHRCFQNLYSVAIFTVPNRPNRECFDHNTLSLTNETYKNVCLWMWKYMTHRYLGPHITHSFRSIAREFIHYSWHLNMIRC